LLRPAPHAVTLHFRGLRSIGVPPYWLGDPGCADCSPNELTYALTGIPADQPATPPKRSSSSHAVAPTTGFNPTWPANLAARASPKTSQSGSISDSHGVSSPTTLEPERVYSTPACHTDYVPSSGFRTLSTASSSLGRPALFHAGNAHGVSLFRGFPSLSGLTSSSPLRLPSWRFSSAKRSKLRNARALDSPQTPSRACVTSLFRLQGFAPTVNPYRCWTVTSEASGRSPPELFPPLQGIALVSRPRRASREPLLRLPHPLQAAAPGTSPETDLGFSGCASAGSPENAGFHSEK
jgi:hypothetical protein